MFSEEVQKARLPKPVFKALQKTIKQGAQLTDPAVADAVASAMKDWAIEHGATHYTHLFQPMTGLTAEKHDSFLSPTGDRHRAGRVQRQGTGQGRAGRQLVPVRRHPGDVRGPRVHRLGPDLARRTSARRPNGATLVIPTVFVSWTGEALDKKTPLLRSMEALVDAGAAHPASCSATPRRRRCSPPSARSRNTS